jgi:acyl dehydratase
MTTIIKGIGELKTKQGEHLGYSDWHEITQEQVNQFAEATGDHQWIHVDPERAKSGPFGTTIAHGYLTMSLAPTLLSGVWRVEGMKLGLNYGINKLRFPSPVPVGSKLRVGAEVANVEDVSGGGVQATLALTFEVEGKDKPACVAEVVYRYYG